MKSPQRTIAIGLWVAGLLAISLAISSCISQASLTPTATRILPTATTNSTPTPPPPLTLKETTYEKFPIPDFDAVHAQVAGDPNKYLIFGNLPVATPSPDLPPELAAFLGRWEGFDYAPPVKKDWKCVLVIQNITAQGGEAVIWWATNLQYPAEVKRVHFRVAAGESPRLEWEAHVPNGDSHEIIEVTTVSYDSKSHTLQGQLDYPQGDYREEPIEFSRAESFFVYKDYSQYLASKRIYSKAYQNKDLSQYGPGYMLYLPKGYEDNPTKTWPLIFFLHGSGDRGDNIFLLAKASPFMMSRETGPLPFIIVAPLLNASQDESLFPIEYMDGVLAEAQSTYRVDAKRIYVTGLSLGGEATYRFAIQHPDTFAAIAPLSAWIEADQVSRLDRIKSLPVWAIHGANDEVISLVRGQQPADALKQLGGNIRFTVLEEHDHDTWTDTYSDPAFYDWLLQHNRP
jgi:predicted esterase